MPKPITYLLSILIALGCVTFAYGVIKACMISLEKAPDLSLMPLFLASAVTSIAAVLATNLGAVLGIAIANPQSLYRQSSTWNPLKVFSKPDPTTWQTLACYVYIIGLLSAAVVWGIKNFTTDSNQIVALIPEMTKSLLGVIVGALAVSLNTNNSIAPIVREQNTI
jgi:hypothetical protein